MASGSLSPLLHRLVSDKRVAAVDEPLSTRPGRPALYRVADSNLRLYLHAGRSAHELARRGRWWNRQFNPEGDLVGADRGPVAGQIWFAGSVKWLDSPFDRHDLAKLARAATAIPGFRPGESGLAVVSLSGVAPDIPPGELRLAWGPEHVVAAWGAD
jgi:uncharacterized protein